jgi:prevent-host-death family protein
MISIEFTELAARFDELLERANQGEKITVTRNGRAYAVMGPVEQGHPKSKHEVDAALAAAARIA